MDNRVDIGCITFFINESRSRKYRINRTDAEKLSNQLVDDFHSRFSSSPIHHYFTVLKPKWEMGCVKVTIPFQIDKNDVLGNVQEYAENKKRLIDLAREMSGIDRVLRLGGETHSIALYRVDLLGVVDMRRLLNLQKCFGGKPNLEEKTIFTCIYCFESKSSSSYIKPEHVMLQSFGKFENNFTIRGIVCDECNELFGNTIDLALGRDSYEGGKRFVYGVKKNNEYESYGARSRLTIKVAEGPFTGCMVFREYSKEQDEIVIRPVPQIGFRRKNSNLYEYYKVDEIPDRKTICEAYDMKHKQSICSFGLSENETREALARINIEFNQPNEFVSPVLSDDVLVTIEGEFDDLTKRAVSKIAFNYAVYWLGPDIMYGSEFDAIRKYIRYGEPAPYELVKVEEKAILYDEPITGQRRLGHLLTMNVAADGRAILCQLSLFNQVTYKISICRDSKWFEKDDVRIGHFFDTNSNRILGLGCR